MGTIKGDIDSCKRIIYELGFSESSKVPYTYHHDCVRKHLSGDYSRADVAKMKPTNTNSDDMGVYEFELYLLTLRYIIDEIIVPISLVKLLGDFTQKDLIRLYDLSETILCKLKNEEDFGIIQNRFS